ncbi:MAG TPA: ABC transporter permease [Terriglobales bacterium]|nr:ABC transporter permease [Terriglobales bacterium]
MARTLWRDRMRRLGLGWRDLSRSAQVERELDEELRFHLEQEAARRGGPGGARQAAAVLGGLEATKEAVREAGDLYGLRALGRDLRFGARLLRRSPLFTLVAVATLGLGIGLNVALFSVVRTVLLRPLPYPQSSRLVTLASTSRRQAGGQNVGWLTARDWQRDSRALAAIATYFDWSPTMSGGARPQMLVGEHVSANFFPTLGVAPLLGRNFTAAEDQPGRNHEVLLSYGFWRRQFGGERGVVGRSLQINHQGYQIVGVMPAELDMEPFRPGAEIWTPIGYDATVAAACRACQHLEAIGRLAPGVGVGAARQEMDAIEAQLARRYPNEMPPDATVAVAPLRQSVVGRVSGLLWLLLGATGMVLLAVCANLANLLLARAALRQREMAVRAALGAGRARLLRQLLAEGALLGLLGGGVGMGLAGVALQGLRRWAAADLPRLQELRLDPTVLLFAAGLSLAAGMLVGLAPALQSARTGAAEALRGSRGTIAGSGPQRMLVAAEMGLAVVLAVGAGLVLKSFVRVLEVSPGFDAQGAYSARFVLSGPGYRSAAAENGFARRVLERLAAQPGIVAAGLVSVLPLDPNNYDTRPYMTLDPPVTTPAAVAKADAIYDTYFVSPGTFAAMGIHLLRGRLFGAGDMSHPTAATIVDASLARKLWPGQNPLGKAIRMPVSPTDLGTWSQVVGVVEDVHQYGLDQAATPEVYLPYTLEPGSAATLVVRSGLAPAAIQRQIEQAVWGLDATVPVVEGRPLAEVLRQSVAQRRLALEMIAGFGGLALLLAALGIYGVVAYTTAQRTGEIGLRMALGADRGAILGLVVAGGMRPAAVGLGLGALGALGAGQLLRGLMYRVSPSDPATFGVVLAGLGAVGLAACWLPAWRASRLDPSQALRGE